MKLIKGLILSSQIYCDLNPEFAFAIASCLSQNIDWGTFNSILRLCGHGFLLGYFREGKFLHSNIILLLVPLDVDL